MQYNHRSRLPPPPLPFGRGGHPRGPKQPCYAPLPPPPFPPAPPPPPPSLERKYEVLMEAGRLATEYLVAQGVLPPAALQRGAGISGAWPDHPLPPPPQLQQQEPRGGYGRRRYKDEYNNNPRRANDTSSSTSSRDDCSRGSYNGRGKMKYGKYRRGYLDSGRDREKERRRPFPNGRRYEEDKDEDGAPGFRRERHGNRGSDEVRPHDTEALREGTPLTAKAVEGFCMEDATSKIMSSFKDTIKDSNDAPKVPEETEEGEVEDDRETQNSETEVVKQGIDTDVNHASCYVITESNPNQLSDGKIQDEIPDEEAEDDKKVMDEATLDHNTCDGEVTNMEVEMHVGKESLIDYCNFTRTPTRPRSARAHRNAASIPGEPAVVETFDLVSSGQASHMVSAESAERFFTKIVSENTEDKFCQENTSSGDVRAPPKELMLLQENGITVVTENMAEDNVDAEPHVVVQQYKEETNLSPLTDALEKSLRQEITLSPFAASHKDSLMQEGGLMQEVDLSPLTANHRESFTEETELPPSTASHKDSLIEGTDLTQTISSYNNNLKLQFKEGTQVCDIDMLPQDVNLIELPDQRKIIGRDVGAKAVTGMEEGKLDQSSSLNLSDVDLVGGTEVAAIHNNPVLVQLSAAGSSTESNNKQQQDPETFTGANASPTDDLCQLPLDNKDVQVVNIECGTPVEVGGFGLSKSIHNNPVLVQMSVAGSSAELINKQQEDPETFTGANANPTDDLCQLPLDNKDVQVIDIECGTPVEVGGFDLSKSNVMAFQLKVIQFDSTRNKMVCSSMDSIMDPGDGIHTDVIPVVQDGYSLAFSDFLSSDIPCYPSMQSDLHAGISANDSEVSWTCGGSPLKTTTNSSRLPPKAQVHEFDKEN
ncbi:hypothetical protein ZEAMMB73_Zm00001d016766 [Zea mays]|uniref:Uncharacterized protein n=1 Tax=Zea mays TaxID=4577 RepID=A0A1D6HA71_MAIZE|nr:hypothetical protein ZEAMMB73_Zm00001d016766 [Zea mays]